MTAILALTASQPIRWQNSNPTSNPAGKQASCVTDFTQWNTIVMFYVLAGKQLVSSMFLIGIVEKLPMVSEVQ